MLQTGTLGKQHSLMHLLSQYCLYSNRPIWFYDALTWVEQLINQGMHIIFFCNTCLSLHTPPYLCPLLPLPFRLFRLEKSLHCQKGKGHNMSQRLLWRADPLWQFAASQSLLSGHNTKQNGFRKTLRSVSFFVRKYIREFCFILVSSTIPLFFMRLLLYKHHDHEL